MATPILPEITKRIAYNRANRDYDCFITIDQGDEQYIGSASTYGQAETKCNGFVFSFYEDSHTPEKVAELALADEPPSETDEAAFDAANQQKVYDLIKIGMNSKVTSLFVDTLPGCVNDCPIDLAVSVSIGAALERNLTKLGITRDQLFRILEVAVNPAVNEYLITPARRMQLIWDGME